MCSYPLELLPSDCGRARVWLPDPPFRLILGASGSRGSPCLGESILLTSSWPFLTMRVSSQPFIHDVIASLRKLVDHQVEHGKWCVNGAVHCPLTWRNL